MRVALTLGVLTGLGLWLTDVALRPSRVPLAQALTQLDQPASTVAVSGGPAVASVLRLLATLGLHTPARQAQLALAGMSAEAWARAKLIGTLIGLSVPLTVWMTLGALGIGLPSAVGLLAPAGAAVGWVLPDLRLAEQVERQRTAFRHALSAYLDLVSVILAGGGGIETALIAAAEAGDGQAFRRLRDGLDRAQRINRPLWTAFDELGRELDIAELRDLAASIGLAGSQGARIRASLAVKADTMRARQIAETRAAAEATTERMNIPTAVLLLGFLLFIVFPAVTSLSVAPVQP